MIDVTVQAVQKEVDEIVDCIPQTAKYMFWVDPSVYEISEEEHKHQLEYSFQNLREALRIMLIVNSIKTKDDAKKLAVYCARGTDDIQQVNARALSLITEGMTTNHLPFDKSLIYAKIKSSLDYQKAYVDYKLVEDTNFKNIDENISFKKV
jgi:hypothetical protein